MPNSMRAPASLERRLPMLIVGLLAIMLAAALGITYVTLRRESIARAEYRLTSAATLLDSLLERSMAGVRNRITVAAGDSSIVAALRAASGEPSAGSAPALAAAQRELERFVSGTRPVNATELWTADGRRIAVAGLDLRPVAALEASGSRGSRPVPLDGFGGIAVADSASIGALVAADTLVSFWAVAPVREGDRVLGFLARRHTLTDDEGAPEAIRGLTGRNVVAYLRTATDTVWSTLTGDVVPAPERMEQAGGSFRLQRADGPEMLAVTRPVAATPLVLVMEEPLAAVLASSRAAMRTLGGLSLVLLAVGALTAWYVSRRLTAPLASLTAAAQAIARGDYEARVSPAGASEIRMLGDTFNRMAEEIGTARQELELQTEEAQAGAEELEELNAELTTALTAVEAARAEAERARGEAESASRAKSDFLAVMSHELRTPLNAIAGYVELMELGLRGPLTDEQRRDLARIRESQKHLLGLISAVLDLTRIESGRVEYRLQPIALAPFLTGVADLVRPQAASKSLSLDVLAVAPKLAVMADREKLRQILLNLLSNAVRHTPAAGRVSIDAVPHGEQVAIRVSDTGEGIPEDALERIFEPFVQLERTLSNVQEGMGLGLAISRDLARGMGGDLTARSRRGDGATFTLVLPSAVLPPGAELTRFSGSHPVVREGGAGAD